MKKCSSTSSWLSYELLKVDLMKSKLRPCSVLLRFLDLEYTSKHCGNHGKDGDSENNNGDRKAVGAKFT